MAFTTRLSLYCTLTVEPLGGMNTCTAICTSKPRVAEGGTRSVGVRGVAHRGPSCGVAAARWAHRRHGPNRYHRGTASATHRVAAALKLLRESVAQSAHLPALAVH